MPTTVPSRLSPVAAQAVFRSMLRALACPGRIQPLAAGVPEVPYPFLLPLVLADFTCTVAVMGAPGVDEAAALPGTGGAGWEAWICGVTGASIAPPRLAGQVVVLDPQAATPELIMDLKTGSALVPEDGARIAVAVSELGSGPVKLSLTGPGVPGEGALAVGGVNAATWEALRRVNAAFPAGVDTWLFAPDGRLAGLSRSTRIVVEELGAVH